MRSPRERQCVQVLNQTFEIPERPLPIFCLLLSGAFALLVLKYERRQLLWFAVTRNPTAEWLARQITEAFPWDGAPKYLIRDNDRAFGVAYTARVRAMGIRYKDEIAAVRFGRRMPEMTEANVVER